jgi:eukaryotic-like serine/threonine-protein kinase
VADLPIIEGFSLVEELGSGTLSSVYAAIEEPPGRKVALKVLRGTIAPSSPFAQQLEREARVLAALCHPNIGLLHAFSRSETRMYLVLEFVDGFSLAAVLKKKPTMPVDSVAAIGTAVARGLAYAHERSIVHRDIKPANILLSRRGEVKIFDFGIAQRPTRAQDPIALATVRLEDVATFGTPAYMSPEQILGENVDARSDIFSLGVVLYQLVCGARPFERGDESEGRPAAHRIRRDPPIPLHRRAPEVPAALERIVMRALEKLPADRFQSAAAMADQLEELAASRTGLHGDVLVARALEHAGLVKPAETASAEAPVRAKQAPARRAIGGLAACGAGIVLCGVALQTTAHGRGEAASAAPLELAPSAASGYVRVLATPWAEVWIDGQRIDVTPFARAIPLPAGTHFVTLVHPHAPAEKRTVTVAAGETRTIDVVMAVPELAPDPNAAVHAEPPLHDANAKRAQAAEREKKR